MATRGRGAGLKVASAGGRGGMDGALVLRGRGRGDGTGELGGDACTRRAGGVGDVGGDCVLRGDGTGDVGVTDGRDGGVLPSTGMGLGQGRGEVFGDVGDPDGSLGLGMGTGAAYVGATKSLVVTTSSPLGLLEGRNVADFHSPSALSKRGDLNVAPLQTP